MNAIFARALAAVTARHRPERPALDCCPHPDMSDEETSNA